MVPSNIAGIVARRYLASGVGDGRLADHPATVQALAAAHRTLRDADDVALAGVEKLAVLRRR